MTDGVDDDDYLNGVASDLMIGIGSWLLMLWLVSGGWVQ